MSIEFFLHVIKGNSSAMCKVCNQELNYTKDGITAFKRHELSKKHKERCKTIENLGMNPMLKHTVCGENSSTMKARKVEIMIANFIAHNDLSFALSDELTELIRNVDLDEKAKKKLKCNRSKCSAIICNVTGKYVFEKLVNVLQNQKFSLIIDESTDVSTEKSLALSLRYRDKNYIVCDQFLGLLKVNGSIFEFTYVFSSINSTFKHSFSTRTNLLLSGSPFKTYALSLILSESDYFLDFRFSIILAFVILR